MTSKRSREELSEVDICDGGSCSEEESGVFVSASLQEDFSGFQRWTSECPNDTSSPPGERASVPASQRSSAAGGSAAWEDGLKPPKTSIVDCLLVELYETYSGGGRRSADSWDSSTEASGSDAFLGRSNSGSSFLQELQEKQTRRHQMNYLAQKGDAYDTWWRYDRNQGRL